MAISAMSFIFYVFIFSCFQYAKASLSISYYSPSKIADIFGKILTFAEMPSSIHIADISARLGGLTPILREGTFIHRKD